jgi:hypothetical protein
MNSDHARQNGNTKPQVSPTGRVSGTHKVNGIKPPGGRQKRVRELLEMVGLNPEHYKPPRVLYRCACSDRYASSRRSMAGSPYSPPGGGGM